MHKKINLILKALIALDILLSLVAFILPEFWFYFFHGVFYIDPEGLLRRCAANWAAFALFQTIALLRWEKESYWLAIVAGLRLSDIFTDWTYLYFAQDMTGLGKIALFVSSPANAWLGLFFLRSYKKTITPA